VVGIHLHFRKVTANQTIGGYASSVFGGNVGVGFSTKVAEPSYRIYIEPRYHYAPIKSVITQLMEVTVGILVLTSILLFPASGLRFGWRA
jgi:hypothetical protein